LAGFAVPDAGSAVVARRGDEAAVGTYHRLPHLAVMPQQGNVLVRGGRAPQMHHAIDAGGGHPTAVGAERGAAHAAIVLQRGTEAGSTPPLWRSGGVAGKPEWACHTRATPSALAVRKNRPSELNAACSTLPRCRAGRASGTPFSAFQTCTLPSAAALRISLPS